MSFAATVRTMASVRSAQGRLMRFIYSLPGQARLQNSRKMISCQIRKASQLTPADPKDDDDLLVPVSEMAGVVVLEEEEVVEELAPWRTLLETAARAAWRASSTSPPEALAATRLDILQQSLRTGRQLRRTHRRVLEAHTALANRRERERQRMKNPHLPPDSLAYKEEMSRDAVASAVIYGPEQTLATLKHRLLPNYAVVKRVLDETKSLIGPNLLKPQRVIDFGIGSGSASAAALDVFEDSVDWVHGIDPSQSMRDSADMVLKAISVGRSIPTRITLSGSLSTQKSEASQGGFDLAICAYSAMELPHVASTVTTAAILWEKLRPNGLFVMVEPGTPDGFNSVRMVRSMLLDCCPPTGVDHEPGDDQCHVIAPCTHNGECPMERHRKQPKSTSSSYAAESDNDIQGAGADMDGDGDDDESDTMDDDENDYELNEQVGYMHSSSNEDTLAGSSRSAETDAFQSAFCSFVHTLPGGRRSKGEKFSYLVAQKRIVGDPSSDERLLDRKHNPFHDSNVAGLLRQTFEKVEALDAKRKSKRDSVDSNDHSDLLESAVEMESRYLKANDALGLDLICGDSNRKSFGRLIRAPMKNRGHVFLDYCCSADEAEERGRIVRHRVSKGQSARVAPGLFAAARKARWGGLWPDVMEKEPIGSEEDITE
jgi:ribosomal protein RSM22 (predicted rRNA methylase)